MTDPERAALFDSLYDAHLGAVLAYARRRCSRETAEDVTAETFLTAWRRLDELPAEPLPWLIGVAANVLANQQRSQRRGERLAGRMAIEPAAAAEDPLPEGLGPDLARALASLSITDRELVCLIAWERLTPAQAAQALGCSHATLRVRLHRARRRLADALKTAESPSRTVPPPTFDTRESEGR